MRLAPISLLLLGMLVADPAAAATDTTTRPSADLDQLLATTRLADDVKRATSPHFEILHTAEPDTARLTHRLEGMYAAHMRLMREFGLTPRRDARRVRVLYLANERQFATIRSRVSGPVAADGFYVRSANFAAFYDLRTEPSIAPLLARIAELPAELRENAEREAARLLDRLERRVIQHEAAHAIQFNIGLFDRDGNVPSWLAEGLSQAFELWEPGVEDVLGRAHVERVAKFRRLYPTPADLPNLSKLIADDANWQPSRDDALGWALVHYLWQERRAKFVEYIGRVSRRGPENMTAAERLAEFTAAFGSPNRQFAEQLHAHILGLEPD